MNFLNLALSALMQGFLYAPMALGVFLFFRILNTPDLTVDGSFVFSMSVCALVTIAGHPILALFAGMLAGALAGFVTGILQTKLKVDPILAGILTMTALYTVNYAILGSPNRYLQTEAKNASGSTVYNSSETVFQQFGKRFGIKDANMSVFILSAVIVVLLTALLIVFFKMRTGMAIRATGDNEEMVRSSSIDADRIRIISIMLSNALVGLSGSLLCQQQRYADLNCGTGIMVMGLAAVIVGQVIFGNRGIASGIISAVVGSLAYRLIIQLAYKLDMPSYTVKLLSALIVALALTVPIIRKSVAGANDRIRRKKAAAKEG